MGFIRTLLDDFRLTTAEILYHLPDYPELLQTFIWQDYDLPPNFPKLLDFLNFWESSLEGRLHSVRIAHSSPLFIPIMRFPGFSGNLH